MSKLNLKEKLLKNWQKFSLILAVLLVGGLFNQCVLKEYELPQNNSTQDNEPYHEVVITEVEDESIGIDEPEDLNQTGGTEVARSISSVGIKSFAEIYHSYSHLTGIDPANESAIRSVYQDQSSQLPSDNDIKSYMTSHQVAIMKLAAEFCHRLFERSQYYNELFLNFDLNRSPNEALDNTGRDILVDTLINRFWGGEAQPESVLSQGRQLAHELIDELLSEEDPSSRGSTRKIAKGLCVPLLTSGPVIFF